MLAQQPLILLLLLQEVQESLPRLLLLAVRECPPLVLLLQFLLQPVQERLPLFLLLLLQLCSPLLQVPGRTRSAVLPLLRLLPEQEHSPLPLLLLSVQGSLPLLPVLACVAEQS